MDRSASPRHDAAVKDFVRFLAFYFLPYPDPWRRRRIRRAARALVTCSPWPGEHASPPEIAQLALLRLLRLQREAHRAACLGDFEALLLLSRAAVETFIAGLYWLDADDAGEQLTAANARSLRRVLEFLVQTMSLPKDTLGDAVRLMGEPHQAPNFRRMSEVLTRRTGVDLTTAFYDQLYIPLSEMFAHPTGANLLRHVRRDEKLTDVPDRWWTRRSAVHTTDVCTAHLAWAIAKDADKNTAPFADYTMANAHRMFSPLITTFVGHTLRAIRGSEWPVLSRSREMLRAASVTYKSLQSNEEREAFAKELLNRFFLQFEFANHDELLDQMIDVFAKAFAQPDELASPP
jgi:hypothetical protein